MEFTVLTSAMSSAAVLPLALLGEPDVHKQPVLAACPTAIQRNNIQQRSILGQASLACMRSFACMIQSLAQHVLLVVRMSSLCRI
jgi:hypothetical protein